MAILFPFFRSQKFGSRSLVFATVATLFLAACGGGSLQQNSTQGSGTTALTPSQTTVLTGQSVIFQVPSAGTNVSWSVNGIKNGSASLGLISSGVYTAPAVAPAQPVQITAQWVNGHQQGSASAGLTVLNPQPQLSQSKPDTVMANGSSVTLSIIGSGFTPASTVLIDDQVLTTSFLSTTQLAAVVPPSLTQSAHLGQVTVRNETPGGGKSSALAITVLNPVPSVSSISPDTVLAGASEISVTVTGSGFIPGSQLTLDGTAIPATFQNGNELRATIPAELLSQGRTSSLQAQNGAPGGGTSSTIPFTIANPQPVLAAISPGVAFAGSDSVSVTLSGSGFVADSGLLVNGQVVPATFTSPGKLSAVISSQLLSATGKLTFAVKNPLPGGGASGSSDMTVLASGSVTTTGNPQVAAYEIAIPTGASVHVEFGTDSEPSLKTSKFEASQDGSPLRVLVAGMKSFSTYHMHAIAHLADGSEVADTDHVFTTGGPTSEEAPGFTISRPSPGVSAGGVEVLSAIRRTNPNELQSYAIDTNGNVVWFYRPEAASLAVGVTRLLDNGNFIVQIDGDDVRELNLAGEILHEIDIDTIQQGLTNAGIGVHIDLVHHDVTKLPNGHYLTLASTKKDVLLNGQVTPTTLTGDVIIEFDEQGKVYWFWNTFDHLDVNRRTWDPVDWTHSNAIVLLNDGNLLLSSRHQSWIMKIDYENGNGDGSLLWKLGYQGDFTLIGNDPIDWFYLQHYPSPISYEDGILKLAVWDNGNFRFVDSALDLCSSTGHIPCYSRAVVFTVDETQMTAKIDWEDKFGFFANFGGSIQQVENGNIVGTASTVNNGPGRSMEIAPDGSGNVIWQLDMQDELLYRGVRSPSLYPNVQWP